MCSGFYVLGSLWANISECNVGSLCLLKIFFSLISTEGDYVNWKWNMLLIVCSKYDFLKIYFNKSNNYIIGIIQVWDKKIKFNLHLLRMTIFNLYFKSLKTSIYLYLLLRRQKIIIYQRILFVLIFWTKIRVKWGFRTFRG